MLKLLWPRPDEHVPHEESMVGTSANNPDVDPVAFVPSCKSINDVNAATGVQVVNSTFSVDPPDLNNENQHLV